MGWHESILSKTSEGPRTCGAMVAQRPEDMLAALLDQPERLRQVSSTVERLQGVGVQLDTAVTILLPHLFFSVVPSSRNSY